eukprot:1139189-Pelagomonas_calceolata.AAC.1
MTADVNAIRRAYKSLAQHIHAWVVLAQLDAEALDIESRHIPTLLREIETTVLSPQIVAQEVSCLNSHSSSKCQSASHGAARI